MLQVRAFFVPCADAAADEARSIGFTTYAKRWVEMIRTQPNHVGKRRAAVTVSPYASEVDGNLIPEFGDTAVREIDLDRVRFKTT